MKKMILLLGFALLCVAGSYAIEEYWININFTRDNADFPVVDPAAAFDAPKYGITGFVNKFPLSTYTLTNPNDENESFTDAVRMSRNGAQHLTFPVYANIGTIRTHYFVTDKNIDSRVPVLYNSGTAEAPVWSDFDPVVEILVKKNDDASTTTRYTETTLNINSPTQIRLGPCRPSNNGPNVLLYAVSISKAIVDGAEPTSLTDNVTLHVVNRNLTITTDLDIRQTSIYDFSGVRVGEVQQGNTYKFQLPGQYIVKVETAQGTIIKKVAVF
ncbi:hypothetical protein MASR2M117_21030 [Paludibacter sp.]